MASIVSAGTTSATALNMSADTSGVLQLASNNGTVAVTVDAAQNVGIGTSSPATKLDVNGDVTQRNGAGAIIGNIQNSSGWYDIKGSSNVNGVQLSTAVATPIRFLPNGAEAARIDSSGNLLVGTTSVASSSRVTVLGANASSNGYAYVAGGNGANAMVFHNAAVSIVGTINCSATATSYNTSSDYRLKENIQPMTGALAKVAALKPVTYTWKADGSAGEGFIAHELQEVCPHAVTGEKDAVDAEGKPVYQGIDVSFLVGTLTAALQEAHGLIKNLETRLAALEGAK